MNNIVLLSLKISFFGVLFAAAPTLYAADVDSVTAAAEWKIEETTGCTSQPRPPRRFCPLNVDTAVSLSNEYKKWKLRRRPNNRRNNFIVGSRRSGTVNLGWVALASGAIKFIRSSSVTSPVVRNEVIAIKIEGFGHLGYFRRSSGINLGVFDVPKYEWQIKSNSEGRRVNTAAKVGLYNIKKKDFVVYCVRDNGINLRWARDCKRPRQR
jgi:hypothetical protein